MVLVYSFDFKQGSELRAGRVAMVLLSIVVVTYDDPGGLARTVSSIDTLVKQGSLNPVDFEVIVVDGFRSVTTATIVEASDLFCVKVISEPDDGIYDAMRKGVSAAGGELVWFLNGGDEGLLDLNRHLSGGLKSGRVHLFSYELAASSGVVLNTRRCRRILAIMHSLPTSHQAMLFPREELISVLRGLSLDDYSICMDYAMAAALYRRGTTFERHRSTAARFYLGGTSSIRRDEIARQAARVQREILHAPAILRAVSRLIHRLSALRGARRQ